MKKYNVFISYAVEDCESVAEGIVNGLRQKGLSVYFVREMLRPGESIEETVYRGLEASRYCVSILSKSNVRSWPLIERSRMRGKEIKTDTVLIFPVWHQLTFEEVRVLFPEMLDRFAVSTDSGMDVVVQKLYDAICKAERRRLLIFLKKTIPVVLMVIVISILLFRIINHPASAATIPNAVEQAIHQRIEDFHLQIDHEIAQKRTQATLQPISLSSVVAHYETYDALRKHVRNEYTFSNSWIAMNGYANIDTLGLSIPKTPHSAYDIPQPCIWLLDKKEQDVSFLLSVAFVDTTRTGFEVDTCFSVNGEIHAWVSYKNPIRAVLYELSWIASDSTLRQEVEILAFKPREEYILEKDNGSWKIRKVK